MNLPITGIYALPLLALLLLLTTQTIMARAHSGVSLGDGGNAWLLARIRRHGNFTETAPFALLLLGLAEASGMAAGWLHAAGLLLVAGRFAHPFGIAAPQGFFPARVFGTLATGASALIAAAGIVLGLAAA